MSDKPTKAEHDAYLRGLRDARAVLVQRAQRRSKERWAAEVEIQRPPVQPYEAYLMGAEETQAELEDRLRTLERKGLEASRDYLPRAPVVNLAARRSSSNFAANHGRGPMGANEPYYCGCRVDGIPVEARNCPKHGANNNDTR